jgi:hypothetical protein
MAWAPDYVTAAELGAHLRIGDTGDDVALAVAISAASRAIDHYCNRQFGLVASPEERRYTASALAGRTRWVIDIDDLMTTTGLVAEVADVDGEIDDYDLEPINAASKGRPWTRLVVNDTSEALPTGDEFEVTITASWGWSAVPTAVKQATLLQASRFHARRDSPYGVAGSPDLGSELRLLSRVDADVAVALRPYTRLRAVG